MMKRYTASLLIVIIACFRVAAETNSAVFQKLSSGKNEDIASAVEFMVSSADEKYYFLLNAVLESSVYVYNKSNAFSGVVVAIPTGEEMEGEKEYKLSLPYPEFHELKGENGTSLKVSLSELTEIKITRLVRNSVQLLASTIQLYHWNPEKRKIAFKTLASSGSVKDIKLLSEVVGKEKDASVIRVGNECINQLLLTSENKNDRLAAVSKLVENNGADAVNILAARMETEKDPSVKAVITAAMDTIQSRNNKIEIAQNLFTGLSLGSVLILMALGLAIIYGLMGIINMAHGEFMMIGAYTTFVVQGLFIEYLPASLFDYYFWMAMPASFIIAGLFGVLIEILVIRHLYKKPLESLLATWGVSLVLIQTARSVFGDLTSVKAPAFASGGLEIVPQLTLPFNRIFIIGLTIAVVVLVRLLLAQTSLGLKIRAVTQNRNMSACLGVPTTRVNRYAFFIGTGIAGLAGWAITLVGNVVPNMGQTYIVDSFLVVVTGGVGKLLGTVFSGLGMGFITKMLEPVFQAVYGKVIILVLVILFLQIKPTGLFPAKGRSED